MWEQGLEDELEDVVGHVVRAACRVGSRRHIADTTLPLCSTYLVVPCLLSPSVSACQILQGWISRCKCRLPIFKHPHNHLHSLDGLADCLSPCQDMVVVDQAKVAR